MNTEGTLETPHQLALGQSMAAAAAVSLIDESLLLLCQKRRTLEEKLIFNYFHRLASVYGRIINLLHAHLAGEESLCPSAVVLLSSLRSVNENVRACVEDLLKILKYDFNFLEQYFEYDYCARLLNSQELLAALEELQAGLEAELAGGNFKQ